MRIATAICAIGLLALTAIPSAASGAPQISTFAGGIGDGGLALGSHLYGPQDVAVDAAGNVYIADTFHARVRKVDALTGKISTVAGDGLVATKPGVGNGGPATKASFQKPTGVAVDSAGNLYISDNGTGEVRKVDANGMISTYVGGTTGSSVDQALAQASGEEGFPATLAHLDSPWGLAFDPSGNLYITDVFQSTVRRVDPSGNIHDFAGIHGRGHTGDGGPATQAALYWPNAVAADSSGSVYITESFWIRKVDASGIISTLVEANYGAQGVATRNNSVYYIDGDVSSAYVKKIDSAGNVSTVVKLDESWSSGTEGRGIAFDSSGNLFISGGRFGKLIKKLDQSGNLSTLAGTGFGGDGGPAIYATLGPQKASVAPNGDLYITDYGNRRIRRIDQDGVISTVAGDGSSSWTGDGGPATSASIGCPIGLTVSSTSEIFFTDVCNHLVRKISSSGIISTIAGNGISGAFGWGGYSGDGGPATSARLNQPGDVAVDATGNVYISDTWNNRVRKVDPNGVITTMAGTGSVGNATGDGGPATQAIIDHPEGIDMDVAGNLYIATNSRVRKVNPAGNIVTIAGDGSNGNIAAAATEGGPATLQSLNDPQDIEVAGDGTVYIAEYFGCKVRKAKFDPLLGQYTMRTVAGSGVCGYSGESGSPSEFALNNPSGLAISNEGDLFVVDSGNLRVLRLSLD